MAQRVPWGNVQFLHIAVFSPLPCETHWNCTFKKWTYFNS
nr:MAG TPA: hypothetical protein [Caudoviricetes sp.]